MDLLKEARKGREAAFGRLFDEHHPALFRFACRLMGSAADAEDIVQECFLELMRKDSAYDPSRTPLRTYLFGAVRNQCLKKWRGKTTVNLESPVAPTPEWQLLRTELEVVVAQAIGDLPEAQREVLLLVHYEQMSLAEIAAVLETEVTTVKSRLQRARAQLKEALAAYV
jgi:RNA polymerase sigma-70 factor, ECF subfamily